MAEDKGMWIEIDKMDIVSPEDLHEGMEAAMDRLGSQLEGLITEEAPVFRGGLTSTPGWFWKVQSPFEVVVGTNVPYAKHVWLGTAPHFPPPDPIRTWTRRKGLPFWPVYMKIGREGTEEDDYIGRAQERFEPVMPDIVRSALRDYGVIE